MKAIKNCPIEECGGELEKVTEVAYDCYKCQARFHITIACTIGSKILENRPDGNRSGKK